MGSLNPLCMLERQTETAKSLDLSKHPDNSTPSCVTVDPSCLPNLTAAIYRQPAKGHLVEQSSRHVSNQPKSVRIKVKQTYLHSCSMNISQCTV
eukprot:1150799-Pelagomonas_calceolata.AAC.10